MEQETRASGTLNLLIAAVASALAVVGASSCYPECPKPYVVPLLRPIPDGGLTPEQCNFECHPGVTSTDPTSCSPTADGGLMCQTFCRGA